MKLRDKIIQKALALFNKHGIANVSPNQIASELDISTGNLTYHFKTKSVLIETLYGMMAERYSENIAFEGYVTLDHFRRSMIQVNKMQKDFRYFFHDIVLITRNYPKVAKMYNQVNAGNLSGGRALVDYYISTDRFIPEEDGINYDFLIQSLWMVGIFWHTQSVVIKSPRPLKYSSNLVELSWYMILPYLTEKGKEEYNQINKVLANQATI